MSLNLEALNKIGCGMYVVTSRKGDKLNGQIANTVFQVTSEPLYVTASINKKNLTYEYIRDSKVFAVSILGKETPMTLIGRFGFRSGRDTDKFEEVNYKLGETGAPIVLDNTVAYMEARLVQEVDLGTHSLFVGRVIGCEVLTQEEPMSYSYYHEVKKGKRPPNAPGYIAPEPAGKKG